MSGQNPVTWGSVIIGVFTSGLAMLIEFGVNITQGQQNAMMGFIGAIIIAAGFAAHNKVTPKSVAQGKIDEAFAAPVGTPTELKPTA